MHLACGDVVEQKAAHENTCCFFGAIGLVPRNQFLEDDVHAILTMAADAIFAD
jgi:hypothetical protein